MSLLQTLRKLQDTDQEWDEKAGVYKSVRERLANQSELDNKRRTLHQQQEELTSVRTRLRNTELEYGSLEEKTEDVKEELYGGRVTSSKELSSLQDELAYLQRRLSELEDRILEGMTTVDELEQAIASGREALETFEEQWRDEQESLRARYKALRARLETLKEKREMLRAQVDPGVLSLYDELRKKKKGVALAPVSDGVCQICRVRVPSHKVQAIRSGERVIVCDGCGRILYSA
ncbi:MAG: C4-type zinc ribbon domain-containing protein [Chloroflexota bacterium]|nr:C4-type zinc ribbon domain-containing protein [Chloroflexota bacterium]